MWITEAPIRGTAQAIATLAVEYHLRNSGRQSPFIDRIRSCRCEKIRAPLKTEVEKDLISGIIFEIGNLKNQLVVVDLLELSRFQVDLCIEAAVKHALILAGALKQPANLLRVLDRARVKPSQRSFSDRSQPVEQLFLQLLLVEPRRQKPASTDFQLAEPPSRRRAAEAESLRSAPHPSPARCEIRRWSNYECLYFNRL
jgi:hypothetical protein